LFAWTVRLPAVRLSVPTWVLVKVAMTGDDPAGPGMLAVPVLVSVDPDPVVVVPYVTVRQVRV
jgi:hypothetical protein